MALKIMQTVEARNAERGVVVTGTECVVEQAGGTSPLSLLRHFLPGSYPRTCPDALAPNDGAAAQAVRIGRSAGKAGIRLARSASGTVLSGRSMSPFTMMQPSWRGISATRG
jgi:hypothetical protein